MNQDTKLLPVVKLFGKEFLVDVENRQFRNFNKPDEVIMMHSGQGRQIVADMQGVEWNRVGLSTGATQDLVV